MYIWKLAMVYVIRQTNCLQVFYETPSMKYVSKLTGKHDRWGDFLSDVRLQLYKKVTSTQ